MTLCISKVLWNYLKLRLKSADRCSQSDQDLDNYIILKSVLNFSKLKIFTPLLTKILCYKFYNLDICVVILMILE